MPRAPSCGAATRVITKNQSAAPDSSMFRIHECCKLFRKFNSQGYPTDESSFTFLETRCTIWHMKIAGFKSSDHCACYVSQSRPHLCMFSNATWGKILVVELLFRGSEESQNSQWAPNGANMEINQKSKTILELSRL